MQDTILREKRVIPQVIRRRGILLVAVVALLLAYTLMTPAFAQSANFRSVDTNSDRVLSQDELVRAFGTSGAARLLSQSDHNGDGNLTISELRRGNRSGGAIGRNDNDDADDDDGDRDDDGEDGDGDGEGDGDRDGDGGDD